MTAAGRFLFTAYFLLAAVPCFSQVITTVAGSGRVLRGLGGPATSATFGNPVGVAVDSAGNVFASDRDNHQVVKISTSGILTLVAGNGIAGFSGDRGPAINASLRQPRGVAVDPAGNVYIADSSNARVRKVSPDGIITTVAGGGSASPGDGGPATSVALAGAQDVILDAAGNFYIAEFSRVRKVNSSGIITTVAGIGTNGYSGDGGPATSALIRADVLAIDTAGNLFLVDTGNHRIRRVSAAGTITTVAGAGAAGSGGDGGPAVSALLSFPQGAVVDAAGNLYIGDTANSRVRIVSPSGTISTIAGVGGAGTVVGDGGPATSAALSPVRLTLDSAGNLYMADALNFRVRKVNAAGTISTVAGTGTENFAGDGGPAASALLSGPFGVAVDSAASLYIADRANNRIRKVSPDGVISTVAGSAAAGFSGDGGLATSASLRFPLRVAVDSAGNLYIADSNNGRVRKVSPGGTISTLAGGGSASPGDNGPATSARLGFPAEVVADGAGNVYIADGHRIRKVNSAGIITTIAGTGVPGYSGDGGQATLAMLNNPSGLAVDVAGNVYVAENLNHRIRRISPGGIITTVAGTGAEGATGDGGPALSATVGFPTAVAIQDGNLYIDHGRVRRVAPDGTITSIAGGVGGGFSGDGGRALTAALLDPRGLAADQAGNVYIADSSNNRIRKVLAAPPTFSASPVNLRFAAPAGSRTVAAQTIALSGSVAAVRWTATTSTVSGGSWLSVSAPSGALPATLTVNVTIGDLAPGTYRGTVALQAALAAPASISVPVDLVVEPGLPAALSVEPASFAFDVAAGGANPPAQVLRIGNAGSGQFNWTAQASTLSGGNWLSLAPTSGVVSASATDAAVVSVNVTGLQPGVYSGSVRVQSSTISQIRTVDVTLLVSPVTQTILLSQSGLLFTGVQGSGALPSNSFDILNSGQGTMNFTVVTSTLTGGNWLSATPSSGSSVAGSANIPRVEVAVNITGLSAGSYSGLVRVNAAGANNTPQLVTVNLSVLPPGSNPGVQVRPTGLIFASRAGASPGSQTVRLATSSQATVEARGNASTFDGVDWLESLPPNVTVAPGSPANIVLQPDLGTLGPGVYKGALTLLFSDSSPTQTVDIVFVVTSNAAAGEIPGIHPAPPVGADCQPERLIAVQRTLSANFASPVGWPSPIEVQVIDNCSNPILNATVVASFSSGDPPLALVSLRNGTYTGTWRPLTSAAQVTVTVRASLAPLAPAEVRAQGQASANPTAPALFTGGVVNGASFARGATLAPGGIVSVFGRGLAPAIAGASSVPLPTILSGTTLSAGGIDIPLFFSSDGQVNAQLPFELSPNSRTQVVVRTRQPSEAITVPETITIDVARAGIFSTNQQGTGQGAILDVQGRLVNSAVAARAGEVVQVYCTGLGITNPRVGSGVAAPGSPLANVVATVEARIGDRAAPVHFAGLAPGFVGLFQVNVEIPAGVTPGSEVSLVLLQNGVPSNTVTLAIR